MQFFSVAITAILAATVSAQAVRGPNGNCGFPNGPTCTFVGKNANRQNEYTEPANSPGEGCCLFPSRCGNGDFATCVIVNRSQRRGSPRIAVIDAAAQQ